MTIDRDEVRQHAGWVIANQTEGIGAARDVLRLLDALERAEAQAAVRGRAVTIYQRRAREAEQQVQAVRDVLDGLEQQPADHIGWDAAALLPTIRHALTPPCGRGPCALEDGHNGPCRC